MGREGLEGVPGMDGGQGKDGSKGMPVRLTEQHVFIYFSILFTCFKLLYLSQYSKKNLGQHSPIDLISRSLLLCQQTLEV